MPHLLHTPTTKDLGMPALQVGADFYVLPQLYGYYTPSQSPSPVAVISPHLSVYPLLFYLDNSLSLGI